MPAKIKKSPTTKKKYLVVFDIDGTLTPEYSGDIDQLRKIWPCIDEFKSRGMAINIKGMLHLLPVGTIELIQLLDERSDVELAFFSAGIHWRNKLFVQKLLSIALGASRYQELKPTLKIMSRAQLAKNDSSGYGKKDLSIFDHDIENIIIVDDNLSVFNTEHIPNVLSIIPIDLFSHHKVHRSYVTHPNTQFSWGSFIDDVHLDDHFASVNQLFYITGLLFSVLSAAKYRPTNLRDALSEIQFKSTSPGDDTTLTPDTNVNLEVRNEELHHEPDFYHKGLMLLRQKNQQIFFVDDDKFLGQYVPKLHLVSNERKIIKKFDDLITTINKHAISAPKLRNGFFAGQLPRNLRELQEQVMNIQQENCSHQDGLLTIIDIARGMGPHHPILIAANACNQLLQDSAVYQP